MLCLWFLRVVPLLCCMHVCFVACVVLDYVFVLLRVMCVLMHVLLLSFVGLHVVFGVVASVVFVVVLFACWMSRVLHVVCLFRCTCCC